MKNKTIKIILMGLDFNSKNLGCSALGHSFIYVLDQAASKLQINLDILSVNYGSASFKGKRYIVRDLPIHLKKKSFIEQFVSEVKKADLIFDFTGGDSFTDIYGLKRFVFESAFKEYVLLNNKPLILGPQTIGPFTNVLAKAIAKHIVRESKSVFVRDDLSYQFTKNEFKITPILTTDIAFMLPSEEKYLIDKNGEKNIGINVSGLMWNGGYKGNNEFGMSLDYRSLITRLIEYLVFENWNIWLIPHVLPNEDDSPENDFTPMKELKRRFEHINLAPRFSSPMEAKGYISHMDFFVGSRMHATIGAFSMGVPTVSIAYSRKFQGLYHSIDYPYVIDGKKLDTEQAYNCLLKWIDEREKLGSALNSSMEIVKKRNSAFVEEIIKTMKV